MSSSDMWTLTPVLCVQHTFERYWNYQHFVTKQRESCKSSCSPSISHSRVAFEAGRTAQKRAWQIPIKVGIWQRSGSNENVETFSGNLCWCQKWELCHASFHMIVYDCHMRNVYVKKVSPRQNSLLWQLLDWISEALEEVLHRCSSPDLCICRWSTRNWALQQLLQGQWICQKKLRVQVVKTNRLRQQQTNNIAQQYTTLLTGLLDSFWKPIQSPKPRLQNSIPSS